METLTINLEESFLEWNDLLMQNETREKESEIQKAIIQIARYNSEIKNIEDEIQKEALKWQQLRFIMNKKFAEYLNSVGEIEIIVEPSKRRCKISDYSEELISFLDRFRVRNQGKVPRERSSVGISR